MDFRPIILMVRDGDVIRWRRYRFVAQPTQVCSRYQAAERNEENQLRFNRPYAEIRVTD